MDKTGRTVDFLLSAQRNRAAALWFLRKAAGRNGVPSLINIGRSGANQTAIKALNAASHDRLPPIVLRQCKYLNNPVYEKTVEQDHRFIKKRTRSMLGFKTFNSARLVLAGVEVIHMIRQSQLAPSGLGAPKTAAEQFYQLAA